MSESTVKSVGRRLALSLWLAALVLSADPVSGGPSKAQKAALKRAVVLYESRFSVPNDSADLAWERATEWVTLVSDMRLDVATDTVLQTYTPVGDNSSLDLACQVNRRRDAQETVFTAECRVNNPFAQSHTRRGSSMLRRYIMTGESACLMGGGRKVDAAGCLLICDEAGQKCDPKQPELSIPEESQAQAEGCSVEQIAAMVKAGLTESQIKAACKEE